jgi:hypothetical protein
MMSLYDEMWPHMGHKISIRFVGNSQLAFFCATEGKVVLTAQATMVKSENASDSNSDDESLEGSTPSGSTNAPVGKLADPTVLGTVA